MELSNIEELIVLTVAALEPDAYAYGIQKSLVNESKRRTSLGTIHTILYRMEEYGILKSELGGSSSKRGGRSKRLYSLTSKGFTVIEELRKVRSALWERFADDLSFGRG